MIDWCAQAWMGSATCLTKTLLGKGQHSTHGGANPIQVVGPTYRVRGCLCTIALINISERYSFSSDKIQAVCRGRVICVPELGKKLSKVSNLIPQSSSKSSCLEVRLWNTVAVARFHNIVNCIRDSPKIIGDCLCNVLHHSRVWQVSSRINNPIIFTG